VKLAQRKAFPHRVCNRLALAPDQVLVQLHRHLDLPLYLLALVRRFPLLLALCVALVIRIHGHVIVVWAYTYGRTCGLDHGGTRQVPYMDYNAGHHRRCGSLADQC
jgi:hypothetical protein